MAEPLHLALTRFEGRADLECPDHDLVVCNVPVQFDPVELVFEVHLPASHDLVQELKHDDSLKLNLANVALDSSSLGVRLEAKLVKGLSLQNPLTECQKALNFLFSHVADSQMRCLVLGPSERKITFTAPALLSDEHPYQVYYSQECGALWLPGDLTPDGLETSVRFCRDNPEKGFISAISDSDFFAHEKRIHAALELIHGRYLPIVLKVQDHSISFYGHRKEARDNYLPLVKPDPEARELTDAVLAALVAMPSDEFERVRLAQKFFLLGKQVGVPTEVQYLMMMTCVEAMDGKKSLQTDSTSQMLGISLDAARLLNGMRHQLTHGKGGYREAFQAVLSHQFRHKEPDLEATFRDCIMAEHQCNFVVLWLRLAERLDAFWCAWLGISESLAAQRYSSVRLLPLPLEVRFAPECPADPDSKKKQLHIDELARKNKGLKEKIRELNAKLTAQGKLHARLKLQHAACAQIVSENQKSDSLID